MHRYRRAALVLAACLGTFLATLDISIVNVALPTLQTALDTDIAGLQWVVNAYALALSAFMLSAGPLGDRYGHRRVWLGSVTLFTAGSVVCACAGSIEPLLAGRAIQGLAGALLIPGAMPILTHAFPDARERARVIGAWSAFSALALIVGPLLGGLLVEHGGWQDIFLVNVPIGVAAVLLGAWGIPERRHPEHAAFDPIGQALSVIWLGLLTYGLIGLGEAGTSRVEVLATLAAAALAFVAFVRIEARVARPLLPVWLFRDRRLARANLASFALGFSGYSSLFFLSLFLQQGQGRAPAEAGWQLMPQFVMTALTSLLFGRIAARIPLHRLMVVGYALIGVVLAAMAGFGARTHYLPVGIALALLGVGMGLAVPATGMTVMDQAPAERAGMASATMNALRQTGMSLGIAVLGSAMSVGAVQRMTAAMQAAGATDAATLARQAVHAHLFPAGRPQMLGAYRDAMSHGFSIAAGWSGILCIAVAAMLLMQREGAVRTGVGAAPGAASSRPE
ncbi:MFS transporter [Burkholderia pseudomultivorans]|uniref:MFS transporter n=1 Tax=Burkholderia pseudomultivorans TaxID=1207504 RepID=UPI000754B205|nr:MFS transporter [Burkholderia pseudomultivorans]AOI87321.1 disulfide bond formation protein DsbA [Burkholderia pseudomultivorans]KVC37319.1 disulfide bond formation protein DsbA [Burkholderia pseudomultivorans]KVC37706.1 disulfide bond formation protein DsbA [Burkholderia pseudomultivorans]